MGERNDTDPRYFPGEEPLTAWHRLVAVALDEICGHPDLGAAGLVLNTAIERWLADPGLVLDLLVEWGVLRQSDIVWSVSGVPNLRIFHECLPQGGTPDA